MFFVLVFFLIIPYTADFSNRVHFLKIINRWYKLLQHILKLLIKFEMKFNKI